MQGSNASWPVGGATRQSGGNWVGRFEKPEDWNIWASMYSSNLELGQLITVGDAILKWTASGVKFVDAAFAMQADLDSFCSKIGTPIATSSTATVAGVAKAWNGTGWINASGLTEYAAYAQLPEEGVEEAYLTNAWAPLGKTRMIKIAAGWQPAFGQILAYERGAGNDAMVDVTATALTIGSPNEVYQSAVLPDWIFSTLHTIRVSCEAAVSGVSSTANFRINAGPSSDTLTDLTGCIGSSVVAASTTNDRGIIPQFTEVRCRPNGSIMGQTPGFPASNTTVNNTISAFAAGQTRFRLMANPGSVAHRIRMWNWSITMGDC